MTFEPLIRIDLPNAILQCIMWSVLISIFFGAVAWLVMTIGKQREERMTAIVASMVITLFVSLIFVGSGMQHTQIVKNEAIVSSNVSNKYQIESLTFPPKPARGPSENYPEQSKPQPVMIMVAGKTRPAMLAQDEQTSEPTLLDFDNGKPLDDLLKTKP